MNETDYNARLYEKMKAEQDKYRDWLLHQEPSEILNHTYEYTMREDIVKPTDRSNTGSEHGATELGKSSVCMGCTFTILLPLIFNLGVFWYAPERRVQWLILKREMCRFRPLR